MKILGTVIGDEAINAKFEGITAKSISIFEKRIARVVYKLECRVKARKLSGQVLKVRTNLLRNSINSNVTTTNNQVIGKTGTNTEYAGVHEYGFNGQVGVREHLRRTKTQVIVFMRGKQKGKVNLAATKKAQREKAATIRVREHTRQIHMPERSFLRSALQDMRRETVSEIYGGVKEMVNA